VVEQPSFVAGRVTTRFLDDAPAMLDGDDTLALAALAWFAALERHGASASDAWRRMGPRRFTPAQVERAVHLVAIDGSESEVMVRGPGSACEVLGRPFQNVALDAEYLRWTDAAGSHRMPAFVSLERQVVAVVTAGRTDTYAVRSRRARPAGHSSRPLAGNDIAAPFPAVVVEVPVCPGDKVAAGDVVVVLEAMKMLHSLSAGASGSVARVAVAVGDQVTSGQRLIIFEENDA
jgi:3-methylcrotonyl-CoA carboxylase alpha subunit